MNRRREQSPGVVECTVFPAPGEPLFDRLRVFLESKFNHSFANVRIHRDATAASSARKLGARAYAVGDHLVFGNGEYNPETRRGLWLLAHELTHVIQQGGARRPTVVGLGHVDSPLEGEADAAADAVVFGLPVPRIAIERYAPMVIRRAVEKCPGSPVYETIAAFSQEVYLPANAAIEANYMADHAQHESAILLGSRFIPFTDIRLPRGAPNKRFGNILLEKLRGISQELQPDIIDFKERLFYEIKTEKHALENRAKVTYQLKHYYDLIEDIRRVYGGDVEPPWNQDLASWKPFPVLPLPGAVKLRFVCTAATDYSVWPSGLVLYDVREKKDEEEQRKRAIKTVGLLERDSDFSSLLPSQRKFKEAVADFNPYLPEFVIVAPLRLYQAWKQQLSDERFRRMYEVKLPPFLDTRTAIGAFHRIGWTMLGLTAAAYAALYGCLILVDVAAFDAGIGVAAAGGSSGAAGGEVISLTAYRAMLASKAAQSAAAAAGVLIVVGITGKANARQVDIQDISAVRVVPVEKFKPYKGRQAFSNNDDVPGDFLQTEDTVQGQFHVGTTVLYDWESYVVIARVSATY
jgi:hypothetical protein